METAGFNKKRNTRIAVSMFFFIQGLVFATWANRIPDIKEILGLSDAGLGTVLFAIPVGQVSAMVLSGWLVNRFGSKKMLITATFLYSLSLIPLALATTEFALMVGLFLFGMTTNLYNTSSNTQGVNAEHEYGKTIMASFHGFWSLGGFIGGLIAMLFMVLDFRAIAHFCAVILFCLALGLTIYRYLVGKDMKKTVVQTPAAGNSRLSWLKGIDPMVVILGIMAFTAMICEGCMYDWSGIYFQQVVEAPANLVQTGYVTCLCTMTVGRFISDSFVTRYGASKVIAVSGLLIFSGLGIAVAFPHLLTALIGFFLVGFGISSTVPICYSTAGRTTRMNSGIAVATVSSIGYLGFLIGPPMIGYLAHTISLHYTFGVIGLLGLVLAVMALRLRFNKH